MATIDIGSRTLAICPFNPNHVMKFSKFHKHFIQCQKQHPNDKRKPCPYNFSELIESDELDKHVLECRYRADYGTDNHDLENETAQVIRAPYNISFGRIYSRTSSYVFSL